MSERWPNKKVIGLTGNIASGKSVVRRMLEHLGAFCIDADGLVHRAMSPGAPAYFPVVEMFGKWVLSSSGQINRRRLGNIAFADPDAMAVLEKITHPIISQVIDILIKRAKQDVIVIEAIKLFEAGLADGCDEIWVVDAPEDVRLSRLMSGRKLDEPEARLRMAAQPPQEEKKAKATVIIDNGGGYEKTWEYVQAAYNKLMGIKAPPAEEEAKPAGEAVVEKAPEKVDASDIDVRRGGPNQADDIAAFLNKVVGSSLTRLDVLMRFGEKAYMLVYAGKQIVGLAGWKVENLIARVDEFVLLEGISPESSIPDLMKTVEQAAFDLQSEIVLLFLEKSAGKKIQESVLSAGYEVKTAAELRVPDWREAAEESAPVDTVMFYKRIREDRVLKPI